ncbi:MAG: InlB B-repeat-containing protein, partial [Prevotella sp.]|nr:InlB B-repeat-containing protein [Prevotella sp.]
GVSIMIEGDNIATYTTDAQGRVELALVSDLYAYTATLAGHATVEDLFVVDDKDTLISIAVLPLAHTLTYTAAANGGLYGEAVQEVPTGGTGTPVTAVSVGGYHFAQWSDGSTQNPRIDTDVQADVTVEAQFEINTVTVRYIAGAGGTISGEAEQVFVFGGDATAVTAVPNSGYRFAHWSDGNTNATRTDLNVQTDLEFEAIFIYGREPMFDLPYAHNFDGMTSLPEAWNTADNAPGISTTNWAIKDDAAFVTTDMTRAKADVTLLSPWFNVSDLADTDEIVVKSV